MSEIKRSSVSSIQIQNFRGISKEKKIKFSKNKRFVILRGENGTGKSSFVNAFEFLFKKDLGAIDFQIKDKQNAFIHKGSKPEDLSIKLNFSNQSYFERTLDDFVQSDKGVRRLYRNYESFLKNASFILNRKKLLNFINVKDGDRYKAISDLCGLDKLESYKNEFKGVKNNFNRDYKNKKEDVSKVVRDINEILNTNESSYDELIPKLNDELDNLGFDLINRDTDLDEYLATLNFSKSYKIKDNVERFNEIYDRISFTQIGNEFESILERYNELSNDSLRSLQYSFKILSATKDYLNITDAKYCPICNNEINNEEILLDIDSKLTDVNENIVDLNSWKTDIGKFISKLTNLELEIKEINEIGQDLPVKTFFNGSFIGDLISQLKELSEFKIIISDINTKHPFKSYDDHLHEIKITVNQQNVNISQDEDYQKIKSLRKVINNLIKLKNLENDLKILSNKKELSLKVFDAYNETKKEYVDQIINNIEKDVKRYYKMLHNEDLISSPRLNVKKDNAISLFLDSFGEESDPRKYSSEGHLDSLGLCIFLAFMKEYNPLDLIVLDDIITTVDFSHKYEIANLLVKEFNEFKILITTHNGLWAQQLGKIIKNNGYNYDDLNIIHWDVITGPVIKKNKMNHESLIDKYVKEGEYSAAVNTARQYLEFTTLEFCKNNTVKIKLDDKYTLFPLYEATKPVSLEKAKQMDSKKSDNEKFLHDKLKYLWHELDINYFIVNNLSHYNDESFFIYSGEAKHLCNLVKEICPILMKFKEERK